MKKILALLVVISNLAFAITADEIMNGVDDFRHLKSAELESKMVIQQGSRKLVKQMKSKIKGQDYGFTEFTNPRDRGTKFLKREDELYMFFPDAEDVVKISGHMLEQGMMGSDFSYKDMLESNKLTDLYDFKIIRNENYEGRDCYVIEGIKKEGTEASYYRRVSWVDEERLVLIKEELYAQSGKLLKVTTSEKIEKIEGRWFATHMVIDNKLKRNTQTEYMIESIKFDIKMDDNIFSLRNLKR